jgi:hypothetical protein
MTTVENRKRGKKRTKRKMSKVTDVKKCPLCGGDGVFELNCDTNEQEFECGGPGCGTATCGFSYQAEIRRDESGQPNYWVETTWYPMDAQGKVLRPEKKPREKSAS